MDFLVDFNKAGQWRIFAADDLDTPMVEVPRVRISAPAFLFVDQHGHGWLRISNAHLTRTGQTATFVPHSLVITEAGAGKAL